DAPLAMKAEPVGDFVDDPAANACLRKILRIAHDQRQVRERPAESGDAVASLLLRLIIAVAKSHRRYRGGRTLGHCGYDAAGCGAVCAAYIELARRAVICARAGVARRTN